MSTPGTGFIKALERRLLKNDLTQEDKQQLERVQRIRRLREGGATYKEIGTQLGETDRAIEQFMRRGVYKLYVDYIRRLEAGDDERQTELMVKSAKQQFAQFAPDAIDFYRKCFRRDALGEFENDAMAQWATEKVSKGLGLTEPDQIVRPVVNIAHAVIIAETKQLDEEDALARVSAKAEVIDVKALPAPQAN